MAGLGVGSTLMPLSSGRLFRAVIVALALAPLSGCAASTTERRGLPPLQTVAGVDLRRYTGTWYEIASFPQSFQRGCTATTATYTLRPDGQIDVANRCRLGSLTGEEKDAEGRARPADPTSSAKLEVSFFRPFWGAYWVIDLAPDYSFAVVGHPSRDYLWILARAPVMAPDTYAGILQRLQAQGYELDRLQRTLQVPGESPKQAGVAP
jgi:apolipoprotein D and lipocalin family protein